MKDHEILSIFQRIFPQNLSLNQDELILDQKSFIREGNFFDLSTEESDQDKDQTKIQDTFGKEWLEYSDILNEYEKEFDNYFDIVPPEIFSKKCFVLDVGCGKGRWSYEFLKKNPEATLICLDISDAIYAAKDNLSKFNDRVIFIKGDIKKLKFKGECFDFLFSLGVIHHIPGNLIDNLEKVTSLSNKSLIYLYYALDNRGVIYKTLFKLVNAFRLLLSRIYSESWRKLITKIILYLIYLPLILFSKILKKLKLPYHLIPLNYYVQQFSIIRIEQDVYDRFFTHIEKRITRKEVMHFANKNSYNVTISNIQPFWHFLLYKKL